jgi:tetratricopeptide (TPR) repeat protein
MNVIKDSNELNNVIENLNKKHFDAALKKLNKITVDFSNKNLIIKLFASIYFQKKDWENSIKYYEQVLSFENEKFKTYNNIGVALFNLGKINHSIKAYNKSIKENSNFDLAYNNLGISYTELGAYEKAVNNFAFALNLNNNNHGAKNNLINTFLFIKPKNVNLHYLIKLNDKINNIDNRININNPIKLEDIKKILNESDNVINNHKNNFHFNETQIYRKNSVNLNCNRHFKVFNEFNIIPKYCFSCYKIQINLKNVVDLIKLFFVFDNLILEKDNIRKCIVEIRPNIIGNYKGYIYCESLDDAIKNFDIISNIITFEQIKISIKHGCSEFYETHPDYKKINFNGTQKLKYNNDWSNKESIIDNRTPIRDELDKKIIHHSVKGINLSDILIIRNWISYATLIGDFSYKDIYNESIRSNFISSILDPQLDFRKKDLLK